MASKTIYTCDCCGREVKELHNSYRVISTYCGYKCLPKTWELCDYCQRQIQDSIENKIKEIQNDQSLGLI